MPSAAEFLGVSADPAGPTPTPSAAEFLGIQGGQSAHDFLGITRPQPSTTPASDQAAKMQFPPLGVVPQSADRPLMKSAGQVESEIAKAQDVSMIPKQVLPPYWYAQALKSVYPDNPAAQKAAGVLEGISEIGSSLGTPSNVSLAAGAGPVGLLGRAGEAGIGLVFFGQQLYADPQQYQAFQAAKTDTERYAIATQMLGGHVLAMLPVAHAAFGRRAPTTPAGTIPAPIEAPPVVGNEQFARVNSTPEQIAQEAQKKQAIADMRAEAEMANNPANYPAGSPQNPVKVNERAGAAVPADNPAPAQSTILEPTTQPEPKPVVPITEENAAQAATDIGGLSYGGVQSWPADSGIPSTLEFTITEPGKETTLSVPPGITPEELIARRDQKLADFAAKKQPTEPAVAQPEPEQTPVTDTEPHISAIANRFTQERAAKGEIGEVAPGQGVSTIDLTQRGLNMAPEEVNQHISDVMNDAGGDPKLQASAIRGEEARLSKRSHDLSRAAEANPTDINARVAADNAFKDLTDFHNGPVAKLKNNWHAQGMAMQGEVPVDLSTLNGLREAWLKDTGKAPPINIEPTLKKTAERVRKTVQEENVAMQRLGQEIEKATKSRKLPTADEVRASIRDRMGLGPCKV